MSPLEKAPNRELPPKSGDITCMNNCENIYFYKMDLNFWVVFELKPPQPNIVNVVVAVLLFTSRVNSYGPVRMVSYPNHTIPGQA